MRNKENQLSDITADLVELEENGVFLERLFSLEAGQWVDAASLCNGVTQKLQDGVVQVTWLDYPNAAHGKGYCIIIFFAEEYHWSNVALYNKKWFLQKLAGQTSAD
jgi:hypothetical protein